MVEELRSKLHFIRKGNPLKTKQQVQVEPKDPVDDPPEISNDIIDRNSDPIQ